MSTPRLSAAARDLLDLLADTSRVLALPDLSPDERTEYRECAGNTASLLPWATLPWSPTRSRALAAQVSR